MTTTTLPPSSPRSRSPPPSDPPRKRQRLSSPPSPWPLPVHITPTLAVPCHPMQPSDPAAPPLDLVARLDRDGYLLFRRIIPEHEVAEARRVIAQDLCKRGFVQTSSMDEAGGEGGGGDDGRLVVAPGKGEEGCGPNLLARQDLANHPSILSVLEHPALRRLMTNLLSPHPPDSASASASPPPATTHPYKWLRAVSHLLHTGPHRDATYFPPSQYPSLLTAWVPLGPLRPELGTLVCAAPSAQAAADAADGPITLGADGTKSGWITDEARLGEMKWVTESVETGDVVVLGRERVHCSSVNMTDEWRLSCDTRWMRGEATGGSITDSASEGEGESQSGDEETSSSADGEDSAGELTASDVIVP